MHLELSGTPETAPSMSLWCHDAAILPSAQRATVVGARLGANRSRPRAAARYRAKRMQRPLERGEAGER